VSRDGDGYLLGYLDGWNIVVRGTNAYHEIMRRWDAFHCGFGSGLKAIFPYLVDSCLLIRI